MGAGRDDRDDDAASQRVFWHRELPPLSAEPAGEHWVEARSDAVPYRHGERDRLWGACVDSLNAHARARLLQEITRLGGSYAHVLDEAIVAKVDRARGEYWLEGRYDYELYREPASSA